MKYQIIIEKWDEDFELIDEVDTMEEAIKIANKVPLVEYKSIEIDKIDETGFMTERYDENGEKF